jgi:transposase
MPDDPEASPLNSILELARRIADECPSCASRAAEIIMWASEIRERRPSREELAALVDATCKGSLPDDQRELLINGLRAMVRFAE